MHGMAVKRTEKETGLRLLVPVARRSGRDGRVLKPPCGQEKVYGR